MNDRAANHNDRVEWSKVLLLDALINFVLGFLLAAFPNSVMQILGVPTTDTRFYTSILGAVLLGIGLALLFECFRKPFQSPGLGLNGAIAINLCGAIFVAGWLLTGALQIPLRGQLFLWAVAIGLVAISGAEWLIAKRSKDSPQNAKLHESGE